MFQGRFAPSFPLHAPLMIEWINFETDKMFYIAIVGRPNVGKSTLFNRIVGGRPAIVDDTPGVTRDRNISTAMWEGRRFGIMDSGGFEPESKEELPAQMREQTLMAVEEADLIFFTVDGREGINSSDREIAKTLRRSGKPVMLVVNKSDGQADPDQLCAEFAALGFEKIFPVSAEHKLGVESLLEEAVGHLPLTPETEEGGDEKIIRLAVVGKPNAGKSSLVNRLLGKSRMMVSDIPGTTRDAIDSWFNAQGRRWMIVDTAGIRRKAKVTHKLEKYSVIMAMKAIQRADVALLMIDAQEGPSTQEAKIAGMIEDSGKACVICVNKWDAVEKDDASTRQFEERVRREMKFLAFAPVVFVSAKTGQRIPKILEEVEQVYDQYTSRLTTSKVNEIMTAAMDEKQPHAIPGKRLKIYFSTQTSVRPPTFVLMANAPEKVHFSYQRYLTNRIREMGGFDKTPIRLIFKKPAGRRQGEER